jgi:hypothetical protein
MRPAGSRAPLAPRLDWIVAPAWLPAWLAAVAFAWWERAAREGPAPPGVPGPAALVGVRAVGWVLEAAWHGLLWRALGARVPVLRLAVAVATLSLFDLLALALRDSHLAGTVAVSVLAGRAPHPGEPPLAAAFAATGACTLARIVCTALVLARALGRGLGGPLALTVAAWLVSRAALALLADLARGGSPLP